MIHKLSLVASTLGLTVVGAGLPNVPPNLHTNYVEISAAYEFNSFEECRVQLDALIKVDPRLKDNISCERS